MAAAVSEIPPDDDEAWLYGDNTAEEQRKEEISAIFERATEDVTGTAEDTSTSLPANGEVVQQESLTTENGEIETEEEKTEAVQNDAEKDSDDDDDSDDDIQVTIGDIKPATATYPYGGTPVNLNIKRGNVFTAGSAGVAGVKSKGLDLETVGVINGVSLYEFNLDSIEDKPWRKPGADITDYFNYGFNEDSWKAYCEKQRKLRLENNISPQIITGSKDQQIPIATVNENSKYAGFGVMAKKAGPPPGRRTSGSIDVICGANSTSRRTGNSKENMIQVMTGRSDYEGAVPSGLPPTHIPPPFIPPNLSVPPPGMGMPPPTIPPPGTVPGHVPYPDLYGNPIFTQPPPPVPGVVDVAPQYDEQFFTGASSHSYDANSESTQHSWTNSPRERDRDRDRERHRDRSRDKERERYGGWERDRSAGRPGDDEYLKRREEYERRRYREYRERREKESRYERDYDRDYHERDRDHDEKRDSRERERKHRDYKEREERHRERSSRRRHHHEEDDEHHSSRHKHKKSKREKEETPADASDTTSQQEPEPEEEKA